MPNFARISINIAQVSGVFDYSIPPEIRAQVSVGSLVEVPFGRQVVQGIVVELIEEASVLETKPVTAVIETEAVVTPAQIQLAAELARTNFSALSSFLELMVPPGLSQHADVRLHLLTGQLPDKMTPVQERITSLLTKRGDLRGSQLDAALPNIDWRASLPGLVKQGVLTSQAFLPPPSVRPKVVRTALFLANVPDNEDGLALLSRNTGIIRERRKRVLDFLKTEAIPVQVNWVYVETGAKLADLEKLSELGLILLSETEVWRDPLAHLKPVLTAAPVLTIEQEMVMAEVTGQIQGKSKLKPVLLHGITGSGKTEIYLKAVEETLALGKQAIILVPEISLTPQTAKRFFARFPGKVGLIHSKLSAGERYDTWRRVREGQISIVVGPRSALFAPLPHPGLIVIDECHDHSYHQEDAPPRYHTVAAALTYAEQTGAVVVLGSATPGIEMMAQFEQQKWSILSLPNRVATSLPGDFPPTTPASASPPMPAIEVVDMREELRSGNRTALSKALKLELQQVLTRGEQAILFLNRRGSASYVFCRDCGTVLRCSRCNTQYTWHATSAMLVCHSCNHTRQMPKNCPTCQGPNIRQFGMGTESLEKLVLEHFPSARTLRWDADTARFKGAHDLILDHFTQHRSDILIGTQMLAKGLDLPLVTLVGVILADISLNLPDFRAAERTFQLVTQVSGRAGRSSLGGRVVLQTFSPDHYAIRYAAAYDFEGFKATELDYRKKLRYPPFSRMLKLEYRHPNPVVLQNQVMLQKEQLMAWIEEADLRQTELIGPAPCYYEKRAGQYRWQILIRGINPGKLLEIHPPSDWTLGGVTLHVTVDPTTLL
jgi:primosomal protein N' (replication factor Y)